MSDNYPPGVTPKDFDAPKETRRLIIKDLLESGPLKVGEHEFESHIEAVVIDRGTRYEIDTLDIGPWSVVLHGEPFNSRSVVLEGHAGWDYSNVPKVIKKKLEEAVKAEVMKQAQNSPNFKWKVEDDE